MSIDAIFITIETKKNITHNEIYRATRKSSTYLIIVLKLFNELQIIWHIVYGFEYQ